MNSFNCSLRLYKDTFIIFESNEKGLKPLLECVSNYNSNKKCFLYDKIIGLGAAKIIVYSKMIIQVTAGTITYSAKTLLEKNKIIVVSDNIVKRIMNKDKTDLCPFEKKAVEIFDNEEYYNEVKKIIK